MFLTLFGLFLGMLSLLAVTAVNEDWEKFLAVRDRSLENDRTAWLAEKNLFWCGLVASIAIDLGFAGVCGWGCWTLLTS